MAQRLLKRSGALLFILAVVLTHQAPVAQADSILGVSQWLLDKIMDNSEDLQSVFLQAEMEEGYAGHGGCGHTGCR